MPAAKHLGMDSERWERRLTDWRGFVPHTTAASAHDIRALWERRLAGVASGHPIWMHVHVPYCPQICTFCHCGRRLLTDANQLDGWIERTRAEIAFYAPVMRKTVVRHQYFGGGTPNLLSPPQLDELFGMLEENFEHDPASRRTLEMLPSIYQPETLDVASRHGLRRLSCGVQSTDGQILGHVDRKPDYEPLRRLMGDARDKGFDDINVDLAWGLDADFEELFFQSLANVLALKPNSVSIHLLAPTAQHPIYETLAGEMDLYRRFRRLPESNLARELEGSYPEYVWRRLPTVLALIRRDYIAAGQYHPWMYSDMETVGVDSFGLGRYSLSHLLGWGRYHNKTSITSFEPEQRGYKLMLTDGVIDGAMDLLSDFLRDRSCDPSRLAERYGKAALDPALSVLEALELSGVLRRDGGRLRYDFPEDSIYMGPLSRVLDQVVLPRSRMLNGGADDDETSPATEPEPHTLTPLLIGRPSPPPASADDGASLPAPRPESIQLFIGSYPLSVVIEEARPGSRYFRVVGDLGVYYLGTPKVAPDALNKLMQQVVQDLIDLRAVKDVSAAEARLELEQRSKAGTSA